MNLFAIIANIRFQDVLDILFLTIVAYHLHLWFRGTKAFKALVGLLVLGIVFTVARTWGLFLTTWVFQIFWQVLVILLIILFQSEIRQVLERVNPLHAIGLRKISRPEKWIPGFAQAIFAMAQRRIGTLMIIERQDRVQEFITAGQPLEGEPGSQLLMSIFHKESPLHDGAALIQNGHITQVACYLPLSPDEGLPKEWGTRHRAALGLSERCDALVVVVSEERGEVSLARAREISHVENPQKLSRRILEDLTPSMLPKKTLREKIRSLFVHLWQVKIGSLLLVSTLWLLLAGQQDFEVTLNIPVEIKNLPAKMEILEPTNPQLQLTVRGLRKDTGILHEKNVFAEMDLSSARLDKKIFAITRANIKLPNDRISISNIKPSQFEFIFK